MRCQKVYYSPKQKLTKIASRCGIPSNSNFTTIKLSFIIIIYHIQFFSKYHGKWSHRRRHNFVRGQRSSWKWPTKAIGHQLRVKKMWWIAPKKWSHISNLQATNHGLRWDLLGAWGDEQYVIELKPQLLFSTSSPSPIVLLYQAC